MRIREPKPRAKPWSKTFQPDPGEKNRLYLRGYPYAATASWWFYAADAINCALLPRTVRVLDARAPSRRPVDPGGHGAGLPATPVRPSDTAAAPDGWRDGLREMLLRGARAGPRWLRRDCCERKDGPVSGCHGQTRRNRQEKIFILFFCGSGSNFFFILSYTSPSYNKRNILRFFF